MSGKEWARSGGMGLVGAGVLWEHVRGPDVLGWAAIAVGYLLLLWPRRFRLIRTPLDWPLVLMMVMGGVSLLITALPDLTRVQVARLWSGILGCYALSTWARGRTHIMLAAIVLIAGGVGLALLAPVTVDWNRAKMVLIPAAFYEPFPLLLSDPVHPNVMAALMVLLFPLPLALLITIGGSGYRSLGLRLLLGSAVLLMGVILLLTKSRGGYIAGAVGGLVTVTLSLRRWWAQAFVVVLAVAVVGAGVWWIIHAGGNVEDRPELLTGAANPGTWEFRQQVWQAAVWMLQDFPFTGVGMGLFNEVGSVLYALYAPQNPGAHNLYLQVGADLGLPGLIAYLALLSLTLRAAVVAARRVPPDDPLRGVAVGGLAGMAALMTHGGVDITVWSTRAAFIPWLVIALVIALYRVTEPPQPVSMSNQEI